MMVGQHTGVNLVGQDGVTLVGQDGVTLVGLGQDPIEQTSKFFGNLLIFALGAGAGFFFARRR